MTLEEGRHDRVQKDGRKKVGQEQGVPKKGTWESMRAESRRSKRGP